MAITGTLTISPLQVGGTLTVSDNKPTGVLTQTSTDVTGTLTADSTVITGSVSQSVVSVTGTLAPVSNVITGSLSPQNTVVAGTLTISPIADSGQYNLASYKVLAEDFTLSNEGNLTNVPGLSIDVQPGKVLSWQVLLAWEADISTGAKLSFSASNSPAFFIGAYDLSAANSATISAGDEIDIFGFGIGSVRAKIFSGTMKAGDGVSTFTVEFAQQSPGAGLSAIKQGTYISYNIQ